MFNQWVLVDPLYSYNMGATEQLLSLILHCKPSLQGTRIYWSGSIALAITQVLPQSHTFTPRMEQCWSREEQRYKQRSQRLVGDLSV